MGAAMTVVDLRKHGVIECIFCAGNSLALALAEADDVVVCIPTESHNRYNPV